MARPSLLLLPLLLSLFFFSCASASTAAVTGGDGKRANKSWILWASGKDEADLVPSVSADANLPSSTTDDIEYETNQLEDAGAFSSLEGMLQWAIGHSDPEKLKEKASDVQRLSAEELRRRQAEIKELMDKLKTPPDTEMMRIAIDDLNNSSISLEERQRALDELLILVEPIDNANDLDKLGGLVAVIRELSRADANIRTTSAWILGKASQNNALVQKQILTYGVLPKLMNMVNSRSTEEAIKALYAVSALIRDNGYGQELFYAEDGGSMLQGILSNTTIDIRLQKKALFLVADLADYQLEHGEHVKLEYLSNRVFLKSVVDLASSSELDFQEKALLAIRSLLKLTYTDAEILKDFCALDLVLERIREHLERLMREEEQRDYASDIEILRREVYISFHSKLEQLSWVPS